VFEAESPFCALYTGFNRNYPKQGKASEVLMIATSQDLFYWHKTDQKLVAPQVGYDPFDWCDPYVLWNDERQAYTMILGACKLDGKKIRTRRTVHFTSTNLKHWDFQATFGPPTCSACTRCRTSPKWENIGTCSPQSTATGARPFTA
jgi:beta-fructofuranosidase